MSAIAIKSMLECAVRCGVASDAAQSGLIAEMQRQVDKLAAAEKLPWKPVGFMHAISEQLRDELGSFHYFRKCVSDVPLFKEIRLPVEHSLNFKCIHVHVMIVDAEGNMWSTDFVGDAVNVCMFNDGFGVKFTELPGSGPHKMIFEAFIGEDMGSER